MNHPGDKIPCKVFAHGVGPCDGLAHIIEARYDEHFTAWYGCVSVTTTAGDMVTMLNADQMRLGLLLEDGRTGNVQVVAYHGHCAEVLHGEEPGTECHLAYFVGTSPLGKPKPKP